MSDKAGGRRFSTSLIVGLLLVPMSAVAAVALVNPDASAGPEATGGVEVVVDDATTTVGPVVDIPEIATADDLEQACGEQGGLLIAKEAGGTISALEQAALDSLRAICAAEDMALPGPPAPDAVVETVTVVAAPAGAASDDSSDDDGLAAEFEEEYAETVAYINAAIAAGAHGEMIDLARQLVAEAGALADAGDYAAGLAKLDVAEDAADLADRRGDGDDDEYDDDDYEDDEEDEDDDEEEEEEEDEDDEDDDEDDD